MNINLISNMNIEYYIQCLNLHILIRTTGRTHVTVSLLFFKNLFSLMLPTTANRHDDSPKCKYSETSSKNKK